MQNNNKKEQDNGLSAKAFIAAGALGGTAGAMVAGSKSYDYVSENLERRGDFAAVQYLRQTSVPNLNAASQQCYEGAETASAVSSEAAAAYREACHEIMESRGLNKWQARWRELESNQKIKTVALAAGAAITIGAVSYMALDHYFHAKRDANMTR